MIDLVDIQNIIATNFFSGNVTIAGLAIFSIVLLIIFTLIHNRTAALIVCMPVTLIFSSLGVLSTDLMLLMIIVVVLGLAVTARDSWKS